MTTEKSAPDPKSGTYLGMDAGLREVLADAVRAPSAHNTQPWRFAVDGHTVMLRADRRRALPVNDPFDRELTVSCGAALCTFEVAARGRGWRTEASPMPDRTDADLLASVHVLDRAADDPTDADRGLLEAIRTRHTYRGRFSDRPLPEGLPARLAAAVTEPEVRLVELDSSEARQDLAATVADADRSQFGDPSWRRELAMWMHPDRGDDGMPLPRGSDLGTRLAPSAPGETVVVEEPDRSLVLDAPLLVVVATTADRAVEWLAAGRALQRVLLTAAAEGVQASYLNQACQVAAARNGVRYLIGGEHHPQAILRFGVPARPVRRTRRRLVEDVLDPADRFDSPRPAASP